MSCFGTYRKRVEDKPWLRNADFIELGRLDEKIRSVKKYISNRQPFGCWVIRLKKDGKITRYGKENVKYEDLDDHDKWSYDKFLGLCRPAECALINYLEQHKQMSKGYARAQIRVNLSTDYCRKVDSMTGKKSWVIPDNGGKASLHTIRELDFAIDLNFDYNLRQLKIPSYIASYIG